MKRIFTVLTITDSLLSTTLPVKADDYSDNAEVYQLGSRRASMSTDSQTVDQVNNYFEDLMMRTAISRGVEPHDYPEIRAYVWSRLISSCPDTFVQQPY